MTSVSLPESRTWHAIVTLAGAGGRNALIVVFLVCRLILAGTLGLGVDECYDIGVAHDLKLSYFDHPPLHYWIAHFFIPLLGDGRALRLPFVAIFAGTTWALYLLTRQLFGAACRRLGGAGAQPLGVLHARRHLGSAGRTVAVVPFGRGLCDRARIVSATVNPPVSPWRTWLVAGFWIGLAGLSKYHAVLFAAGLLVYLVSAPARRKLCCTRRHGPAPRSRCRWCRRS